MTKLKPLFDNVLVQRLEAETKTKSGLIIPDNAKEKPQEAKVIAVGGGKKDEPMEVKKGDVILFSKWGGTEIKIDGEEYLILKQSDILAIKG